MQGVSVGAVVSAVTKQITAILLPLKYEAVSSGFNPKRYFCSSGYNLTFRMLSDLKRITLGRKKNENVVNLLSQLTNLS